MKLSRILIVGVAVAAGGAAMVLTNRPKPAAGPAEKVIVAAPAIPTERVLVAAKDIPLGTIIAATDMSWATWPRDSATVSMTVESRAPKAFEEDVGAIARDSMVAGEPIINSKLVKGGNGGFMSAMLPTGMRAVAINIEGNGSTTAGGFILPNDHVDVVRTYRDSQASKTAGSEVFAAETVLGNVRVLAIGQNIKEKDGKPVVIGSNATLEVTASQAEDIMLAQKTGILSLSLRSIVDANQEANSSGLKEVPAGLTVVRYGIKTNSGSN